jgi:hypothetical protein
MWHAYLAQKNSENWQPHTTHNTINPHTLSYCLLKAVIIGLANSKQLPQVMMNQYFNRVCGAYRRFECKIITRGCDSIGHPITSYTICHDVTLNYLCEYFYIIFQGISRSCCFRQCAHEPPSQKKGYILTPHIYKYTNRWFVWDIHAITEVVSY